MTIGTESFLSQLDKAAQGTSYSLIEFEGLLDSMKETTLEVVEEPVEEEIKEELEEEIVEVVVVDEEEESVEVVAADMELAMEELQGLFEGISGLDLTEPEAEPEIVLESIDPVEELQPQIQIDPAMLEAVTEELKGLFSGVVGYDLFSPPPPEPEPEPEPEPILEKNFFEPLEDTALSISEKYAGLPIVTPKYEIGESSHTLINHAAGKMNTSTPIPKDYSYAKYDPSVAQGDANWQMSLFNNEKNSKAAQMVNDVSQLLEKHKKELPEKEYKILEGNAVEQAAQYLNNIKIEEEVVERSPEDVFNTKVRGIVNNILSTNVGWGQRGMTYGSGEVRLKRLDDVDATNISATHQFLAWDASINKFVAAEGTTPVGDINGVTAGVGLSGGGTQGTVTLDLDVSELTAIGATADMTDYVVIQDATDNTTKKVLVSNLPANEGVITGVQAGTGLSGGGSSGTVTINVEASQTQITGLGTITTGAWTATDVAVAHGGTGASSASTARTNLGLAIGTNVQAYNATLDTVSAGTYAGDNSIVTVGTIGTGTWQGTAIADTYIGNTINATHLADGTVTNTELQYINSLSSNAQTQIDGKAAKGFVTAMAMALG